MTVYPCTREDGCEKATLLREIARLEDEVAIWKDRYQAIRADFTETVKACDKALNELPHDR